jgi:hypothetical protein
MLAAELAAEPILASDETVRVSLAQAERCLPGFRALFGP